MTFFQYLVLILGLLLAGGSQARAADDGSDTSTPSSTSSSTTGSPTAKTHHKTHHTKSSTAGTNAASATPTADATASARRGAAEESSSETAPAKSSSARDFSASHAADSAKTSGDASGNQPADATASSTGAGTTGSSPATGTHHSHHHTAAAAGTTNSTVAPATADASAPGGSPAKPSTHKTPATAPGAAPPAGTLTNQTNSATSTTSTSTPGTSTTAGTHHRHHTTTTATAKPLPPPPPIVVPDIHPSVVPQPPAATATLPAPPPLTEAATGTSAVPTVQTGLPVARPGTGTTATLPIGIFKPKLPPVMNFPFKDYAPERSTRTYPWKVGIITTVFWIGEGSTPISSMTNRQSAWDMNWVHNNGGADDPGDMSGYASASHASMLNPFYVALPFNDLAYPDKTARWLPNGWYKGYRHGDRPVSSCQGRWIEIKIPRTGRYCFAQWEDVGPIGTDDAEYVFGPSRPSASRGLDVSPAVAKYLGFESTTITSWRFVDDGDVIPGMWLRYDEQALLLRAIRDQIHSTPTPRIQDSDEPTADSDDSTRKRAGAAGGY